MKKNTTVLFIIIVWLRVWNYPDLDIHIVMLLTAVGKNILTIKPWLKPTLCHTSFADVSVNRFFAHELSS